MPERLLHDIQALYLLHEFGAEGVGGGRDARPRALRAGLRSSWEDCLKETFFVYPTNASSWPVTLPTTPASS
jgi:hypothetical protein